MGCNVHVQACLDKHGFHILADFVHTTAYNTSDPFARYTTSLQFLLNLTSQSCVPPRAGASVHAARLIGCSSQRSAASAGGLFPKDSGEYASYVDLQVPWGQ